MVKLLDQPWDNYYETVGFYEQPEDSMDVIFFGSRVSFCDINPMEIINAYSKYDRTVGCAINLWYV